MYQACLLFLSAEATNPVFLELNNNELHIRRNSYELAIKSDYIESSSTDNNNEKAPGDDNDKAPGDNSEKAPGDDGGKTRGDDNEKAPCDGAMSNSKSKKKAINFFQAFLIPGVIVVSIFVISFQMTHTTVKCSLNEL